MKRAGLLAADELGPLWDVESFLLHQAASQEAHSDEVYNGMIHIACMSLANMAKRGLFGDHARIDFNVSEVGDDVAIIAERDRRIRAIIGDVT